MLQVDCVFFLIIIIYFRYGANSHPKDGGMLPIIAILDKLIDTPCAQIHVEICLKLLLKTVALIEMPYKVITKHISITHQHLIDEFN